MTIVAITLNSAITLCMLGLLLRWAGPYLEIDIHSGRLRWLPRLTDPYIGLVRGLLPAMGPMDFAPIAAIMGLWLLRMVLTGS